MRLFSRNGNDWSDRYPWVVEPALKNRHSQFVIDGEAVVLGIATSTRYTRANTSIRRSFTRTPVACPVFGTMADRDDSTKALRRPPDKWFEQ